MKKNLRIIAFEDAKRDIALDEAQEVAVHRIARDREKEELHYKNGRYAEKGIGWCAEAGCDNTDIPPGHFRCAHHTYAYYFPYFVLAAREYSQIEIREAA